MIGRSTPYGNPYKLTEDGGKYERAESVQTFAELWYSPEYVALRAHAVEDLTGETLGCYCLGKGDRYAPDDVVTAVEGEPRVCHGEVILQYLNRGGRRPGGNR